MVPLWVNLKASEVPYAESYSLYMRTKSTWTGRYSFFWFNEDNTPAKFRLNPHRTPVRIFNVRRSGGNITPVNRNNIFSYNYGESQRQVEAVKADTLHSMGITGKGVKIGIFDTGFDLSNPALFGVKVGDQMDFNSGDRLMMEDFQIPVPVIIPFYVHSYDCDRLSTAYVCVYAGADEKALQGVNTRAWNLYLYVLNDDSSWTLKNVQIGYEYNPSLAQLGDSIFLVWTSGFGNLKMGTIDTVNDTINDIRTLTGGQKAVMDTITDTLTLGIFSGDSVKLCYYSSGLLCWNSKNVNGFGGMSIKGDTLIFSDGDTIFRMTRTDVTVEGEGFYPVYASGKIAYVRNDTAFVSGRPITSVPMLSSIGFSGAKVAVPEEDHIAVYDTLGNLLGTYGWTSCDKPYFVNGRLIFRARGDTIAEAPTYGIGKYHGTRVLSVLAGYIEGRLIGVAPGATYYLAKTEKVGRTDTGSVWENRIEEDFLVAALEWAARRGVQIVNVSLGYGADLGYTKDMMDGKTAVSSRAFSQAVRRGVLVVASMGNVGNRPLPDPLVGDTTLTAPADAYDIVAVSGVIWDSVSGMWLPANRSAFGPSADGRVKPEVTAPFTVVAVDDSFPLVNVSGTSYSAPLTVGALALALEVHPSWDMAKLRQKLLETAYQLPGYTTPNFLTGYGMADAYALATAEPFEVEPTGSGMRIAKVYPNPYSKGRHRRITFVVESPYPADYVAFRIYSASGYLVREEKVSSNLSVGETEFVLNVSDLPEGLYFVSVLTERGFATGKFVVVR